MMNYESEDIYVKANLKLFTNMEGGRIGPIRNNYRPNHVFEYKDNQIITTYIGEVQFNSPEVFELGTENIVTVRFLNIPKIHQFLTIGRIWWIHEGSKRVGEAKIIEILS